MKFTADCPSCEYEFEVGGVEAAKSGLKCPACGIGFVPGKIHRVEPQPTPIPERVKDDVKPVTREDQAARTRREKIQGIEDAAENAKTFAWLSIFGWPFLSCVIAGIAGRFDVGIFLAISGVALGLFLHLIAQLLRIRAALEKTRN